MGPSVLTQGKRKRFGHLRPPIASPGYLNGPSVSGPVEDPAESFGPSTPWLRVRHCEVAWQLVTSTKPRKTLCQWLGNGRKLLSPFPAQIHLFHELFPSSLLIRQQVLRVQVLWLDPEGADGVRKKKHHHSRDPKSRITSSTSTMTGAEKPI